MRRKVSLAVAGFAMAIGVGLVVAPSTNADTYGFYHS
jgi:hypothetical protein